ncbi:hypothetical protein HYU19_05075 [Candidatus Woesearchaeota archaeon]|nr:hypothetical protein [Candidatus Woesearchaeota archaeon]
MGIEKLLGRSIGIAVLLTAVSCGDEKQGLCRDGGTSDPANDSQTQSSSCSGNGCSYDLSTVTPCTCRYACMEASNCQTALPAAYPHSTGPFLDCYEDCERLRQQNEGKALEAMDCISNGCTDDMVTRCGLR